MVNYARGTMPEERKQIVENFCSICDRYKTNCSLSKEIMGFYGTRRETDQERYALKGFCGWAIVNGRYASIREQSVEFKDAETVPRSDIGKEKK